METPSSKNCFIIPRKYFNKRGIEIDNSLQKYSGETIPASISMAKIRNVVSNGQVVNKTKSLTGIVTLSSQLHILETNDRIQYNDVTFTINAIETINDKNTLSWLKKYNIEAS